MTIKTITTAAHITAPSPIYNQSGLTEEKAVELFKQACEQFNLDNATDNEAGGRGYDYHVELIEG